MSEQASNDIIDRIGSDPELASTEAVLQALYGNATAEEDQTEQEAITEAEADTETEPEAQAQAEPESSEAADAAEEHEAQAPAGVATKDGKRVIPYAVLQDARTAAAKANERAAELATALERLREELTAKQAAPAKDDTEAPADVADLSDDELAELAEDFPAVAKAVKAVRAAQARMAETLKARPEPASAPAAPADEAAARAAVQDAIDQHELLARWQAKGGALWSEATALDNELRQDPEWATKSMAERFAEVQRRVAEDNGIPLAAPKPKAGAKPAAPKPAAQPRVSEVTPTLTDLAGTAVNAGPNYAEMAPAKLHDVMLTMSPEEIRRLAGLSY
jgi:hypothetical protein